MDRRLLALAAVVTGMAAFPNVAAAAVIQAMVLPIAGMAAAIERGARVAILLLLPGLALLAWRGAGALAPYAASAAAGVLAGALVRRGLGSGRAIAVGVVPIAAWTVSLAISGFDPVVPEMTAAFERVFATEGASAAIAVNPEDVLAVVRHTWVGVEIVVSLAVLALAYRVGARLFAERVWPPFAPFTRFDLPDVLIGAVVVGLAAVLVGMRGAPPALLSIGGNLLVFAGLLYAVRGIAIQAFWLARAGVGRGMSTGLLATGAAVFLPVFPMASSGLGLFDTWFDFRRVRNPEKGENPFSVFRQSSGDDGS